MSVAAPADRPAPLRVPRHPVSVVAHRGASAYAPENTLPAVELAVAMGADTIEVDVQGTADGALVVLHDTTLARTTDAPWVFPGRRPWRVGELALAEIRRLDAGAWFAPAFAGTRVPTLPEVLEAVRGRASVLLEIKRPDLYPGIAARVARAPGGGAGPRAPPATVDGRRARAHGAAAAARRRRSHHQPAGHAPGAARRPVSPALRRAAALSPR